MLIIAYLINIVAVIALNPLFYETLEMESPLTVCTILVSGDLETTVTAAISTEDQTAFGKTDSLSTTFYKKKKTTTYGRSPLQVVILMHELSWTPNTSY